MTNNDNTKIFTIKKSITELNNSRIEKQHSKGKLTARERLNLLFDKNTFSEEDIFMKHRCADFDMDKIEIPSDGVVTAHGKINGKTVFAYAQDFTIMGGTLGEIHAKKICNIQENAIKLKTPLIALCDSGGARIQEGVNSLAGYGKIFYNNTLASGLIPQIAAIMGPSAGGAVYSSSLSDFVFMVNKTSKMFITGPEVVEAVTGEKVDAELLGGALTHNKISGVAHFFSNNDTECIQQIRRLLYFLTQIDSSITDIAVPQNNLYNIPELNNIIPQNPKKTYDVLKIINLIADNHDFMEYQPFFAQNIVTGFCRINNLTTGIIANQSKHLAGCLDIDASDKAARFIRTCDCFDIQILNIIDVPGFLPGTDQEYNGIIRHGAKMLYAYSEATVPKISLIIRKAFGGAFLAMCSKDLGSDYVFAWPSAEIAVMGPEGAAQIIFKKEISESTNSNETRKKLIKEYSEKFASPLFAASYGHINDIIEPADTKQKIIDSFEILKSKYILKPEKKHGNIPL